jgi:SPP1 family predicted phage head-tail adaptor
MIGNTKPIKLIKYTQTIDAEGDATETIAASYKMWAEISEGGGGRSQADGKTEMSDTKTFRINFRNYNITPDFRIEYFGQNYSISSVRRINEKRFNWELTATAIFELV